MSFRLKFTALSLVAYLVSYCATGQEIKDGFIILANGTYEYGLIQFDPTLNAHEECLFGTAAGKPFTKFTPEQVLGYGVIDGIHFATKEITNGATQQKLFLIKEFDEVVQLYSFQNSRLFVEKESFVELTGGNYKALLAEALGSCKNTKVYLKKTPFDPQKIRNLFIKYQRCTDPESETIPFTRFHFDVMAGVENNTTTLKGKQEPLATATIPLTDKTLLSGGVHVMLSFKNSKRFSLVSGVFYYQQNFYSIRQSVTNEYSSTDKINFDYNELLIPITFQYSLFKAESRVMPYLKAGISVPFTLTSSLTWQSEKEFTSAVYFEQYNLPQDFKQSLQPTLSVGATFDLIHNIRNVFEISYIKCGGELETGAQSITVTSSRFVVLLGFRF